jgi:hypothetical protein
MADHNNNLSYVGGIGRRIMVQGQPRQKHETLCKKITKAKRDGEVNKVPSK